MFKAEKDRLKDFHIEDQLFGSFGKGSCKSLDCWFYPVKEKAIYLVRNNGSVVLEVSDLDIAIEKFNEI